MIDIKMDIKLANYQNFDTSDCPILKHPMVAKLQANKRQAQALQGSSAYNTIVYLSKNNPDISNIDLKLSNKTINT